MHRYPTGLALIGLEMLFGRYVEFRGIGGGVEASGALKPGGNAPSRGVAPRSGHPSKLRVALLEALGWKLPGGRFADRAIPLRHSKCEGRKSHDLRSIARGFLFGGNLAVSCVFVLHSAEHAHQC